jgi:hypothetical protein
MSDLFGQPATSETAKPAVQQLFVDEVGTPTLFHENVNDTRRTANED